VLESEWFWLVVWFAVKFALVFAGAGLILRLGLRR
jgi:hypothetical protein